MNNRSAVNNYTRCFFVLWTIFSVAFFLLQQSEICYMYDVFDLNIWIYNFVIVGTMLLCVFGRKYSKREIAVYAVITFLVMLSILKLRDRYILVALLFFIAAGQINMDQFVRFDIKLKLSLLVLIVGLCALGLIDNYSSTINGAYKQALGFLHPNTLACFSLAIVLEYIYLRYKRFCIWDMLLIAAVVMIIWKITMSRTNIYTFSVVFFFTVMVKRFPRILKNHVVRWILCLLPTLCSLLCLLLIALYSKGVAFVVKLDSAMTYRISAAERMFARYGFSMIGQKVVTRGTRSTEVAENAIFNTDMAYIAVPIRYGVIISLLLLLGAFLLSRRALRCHKDELIIMMVYFALLGIAETALYRITYNFLILFMMSYRKRSGKKYSLRQFLAMLLQKRKRQ